LEANDSLSLFQHRSMVAGQGYQFQKRKFEEDERIYWEFEESRQHRASIAQFEKELVEQGLLHSVDCICQGCRKVRIEKGVGKNKFKISRAINCKWSKIWDKWNSLDLDKFEQDSAKRRKEQQIDIGSKFIINIVDICPFSSFN
jgi:hypothetical protein